MTLNASNIFARLKTSPLALRFMNGAIWSVLGSVVSSGTTLILMMMVARLLGKEVYGQFVIIQGTLSTVGVFAGFGIGAAATRYAAELKFRDTDRLGHILSLAERTILGFGVIASTGLVITAQWMATNLLNSTELSQPLAISAGAVVFTALDSYQKSVLIGFESMRSYAIGTVIGVFLGFPIMLLGAKYFALQGAAVAIVISALLQTIVSRYQMLRELKKFQVQHNAKGCLSELHILWHFALPALLSGVLIGPTHWGVQAMLARTPTGYAELAVLGIAMQWFNFILFVPSTAARVVGPILTDYVTKKDHANARKILLFAMGANSIFAIPLLFIVCILSPFIMSLYGESFAQDYVPLILAASTAALLSIQIPVGNMLAASSKMWLGALMNFGWATVYLSLSYCMINKGAIGVFISLGIAYCIHACWTFWFAFREVKSSNTKKYMEQR